MTVQESVHLTTVIVYSLFACLPAWVLIYRKLRNIFDDILLIQSCKAKSIL